jgi:hypothetical protein
VALNDRRGCKSIKSVSLEHKFHRYSPSSHILVLATGSSATQLAVFLVRQGSVTRIGKVDLDHPAGQFITERNISIVSVYGRCFLLHMRVNLVLVPQYPSSSAAMAALHSAPLSPSAASTAVVTSTPIMHSEIVLYSVSAESISSVATLRVPTDGSLVVSVVDNLIVVVHREGRRMFIFDIMAQDVNAGDNRVFSSPLPAQGIIPCKVAQLVGQSIELKPYEMFPPKTWFFFYPDVIIDGRNGLMWRVSAGDVDALACFVLIWCWGAQLQVRLPSFIPLMPDTVSLIDFLLRRSRSLDVVVGVILDALCSPSMMQSSKIAKLFDDINLRLKVRCAACCVLEILTSLSHCRRIVSSRLSKQAGRSS